MPLRKEREVSKARWSAAQEQEKRGVESAEEIREWIRVRRQTWANLLESLKGELTINSLKTLDIGGGPTSIFLAFRKEERYMVDPNLDRLFRLHPFVREIEEYRDVNFISSSIEEAALDKQFDLIFMINVLDHVGELKPVLDKIDELLAPSGILVIVVDCYADSLVRGIVSFFDPDPPHPHQFIAGDIHTLFSHYQLNKQDSQIFKIINEPPFRGERSEMEFYRIDKFFTKMRKMLKYMRKQGDAFFISKYILCYGLALLIASFRRREKPIYPFKKARLFVFQKLAAMLNNGHNKHSVR